MGNNSFSFHAHHHIRFYYMHFDNFCCFLSTIFFFESIHFAQFISVSTVCTFISKLHCIQHACVYASTIETVVYHWKFLLLSFILVKCTLMRMFVLVFVIFKSHDPMYLPHILCVCVHMMHVKLVNVLVCMQVILLFNYSNLIRD